MNKLAPKYHSQSSARKNSAFWAGQLACLLFLIGLNSCEPENEPENEPPIANLEVSRLAGEIPVEVRLKVSGQDPDGIEDIIQYVLYIGNESVKSNTPIDIKRTFDTPGTVEIYGEVIDSENQSDTTEISSLVLTRTEGIEQSASLIHDIEISYAATLKYIASAELTVIKDGNLFFTQQITDNSVTGNDYFKVFKNDSDGITKGTYEFILKAGDLERKTTVEIPNYIPTLNLSGINADVMEGTEITLDLRGKAKDQNPEDMPVSISGVSFPDGKTHVSLNWDIVIIGALLDKLGIYQVEFEFGSTSGGFGHAVLSGNIIKDTRWVLNPFVQPNDSTKNWYGSGDVNNDNVLNSQDVNRISELINGTYSNPSDTRLKDRADVNGDGVVISSDRQILENRVNGLISYMPGEWNELTTKAERVDWLTKMLAIDKTDEMQYIPGEWVCLDFARQIAINFHGFGELGFSENNGLKDNGRFNIPVYIVILLDHAINTTYTGDMLDSFEDATFFEPQSDEPVPSAHWIMPTDCILTLKYSFGSSLDNSLVYMLDMFTFIYFIIENSIPVSATIVENLNSKIIRER